MLVVTTISKINSSTIYNNTKIFNCMDYGIWNDMKFSEKHAQ